MRQNIFKLAVTFVLLIVYAMNGKSQSHIGDLNVNVGSTTSVKLSSSYTNPYHQSGTTGISFLWSSSNTSIFTVTSATMENAIIKGVKAGTARLYYKSTFYINGNKRTYNFYYDVTVSGEVVVERDLQLETGYLFLAEGESYTINATQSGVAGGVYCTSDDDKIATAEPGKRNGWITPITVTAVSPGVTNIHVMDLSGLSRSCQVTVKASTTPATNIPYAVYNDEVLTFYYDNQRESRVGTTYDLPEREKTPGWYDHHLDIKKAIFDPSFADARPTSTHSWFIGNIHLSSIDGMEFLNTSSVTDMSGMFFGCYGLSSLDLSNFETSLVVDMAAMFYDCNSLTSLDLSNFNTRHVLDMCMMFCGCSELVTIYCGNKWSKRRVISSSGMFKDCPRVVGGAGTVYDSSCTDVSYAHDDGGKGKPGYLTLKGNNNIVSELTAYAVYKDDILTFYYDDKIENREGIVIDFDPDNPIVICNEFWTSGKVFSYMDEYGRTRDLRFAGVYFSFSLYGVEVVEFDPTFTSCELGSTANLFSGLNNLKSIKNIQYLNTSNVRDMSGMFGYCSSLTSIDLSYFDTSNVVDMSYMFCGCKSLLTIYVGENWNMSNVVNSENMFLYCDNLTGGQGTTNDSSHEDASYAHVDGGYENPGYLTFKSESNGIVEVNRENKRQSYRYYSIDGHCLNGKPDSGIYIVDGKKMLSK